MERGRGIRLITFPAASALCVTRCLLPVTRDSYNDFSQHESSLSLNQSLSHARTIKHFKKGGKYFKVVLKPNNNERHYGRQTG